MEFNLTFSKVLFLLGFLLSIKALIFCVRLIFLKPGEMSYAQWLRKIWWCSILIVGGAAYIAYFLHYFFF